MWVLPTLGRPEICQRALDSIIAAGCSTTGMVVVDGDPDPRYRELRLPPGWVRLENSHNRGLLDTLNWAFHTHPDEPWYGLLNDDFLIRTPGWDKSLVAAAGALGFASSNDLWQAGQPAPGKRDGRMCGALAFGGDMLRALGWWTPPGLFHCFADDAWEEIATRFGNRRYLREVIVEHWHADNGKAERDATYRHAYGKLEADRRTWIGFQRKGLPDAIERLARARGVDLARIAAQNSMDSGPAILALTASFEPGYVDIPDATGTGVFTVSTVNLGAGGVVTVSADTGVARLPVNVAICQTDPATGACFAPPTATVTAPIAANETPTFGIFVTATAAIDDAVGVNRVFVTFTDASGLVCGETSVAARTTD